MNTEQQANDFANAWSEDEDVKPVVNAMATAKKLADEEELDAYRTAHREFATGENTDNK